MTATHGFLVHLLHWLTYRCQHCGRRFKWRERRVVVAVGNREDRFHSKCYDARHTDELDNVMGRICCGRRNPGDGQP